ncbi:MAG TPA: HhH-GPD-type base excision DNA repair protein, partial [Burkholderiales bacterium]|nr:HhH-GPD-type base excision DNA repair protein [Burkholderiales bacterium]
MREVVRIFAVLLLGSAAWTQADAQSYPSKQMTLVVPFPPGAATDVFARAAGRRMGELLGAQIVVLNRDGTALLIGMLLDQQVPMEWAFAGPATLRRRLGHLDAVRIAAMDVDGFVAVCCEKPAIHRFPAALGRRIHALCEVLVRDHGGRGEGVWEGVDDGAELYRRLLALPGYGDEK